MHTIKSDLGRSWHERSASIFYILEQLLAHLLHALAHLLHALAQLFAIVVASHHGLEADCGGLLRIVHLELLLLALSLGSTPLHRKLVGLEE